jgi:hypothetical protein
MMRLALLSFFTIILSATLAIAQRSTPPRPSAESGVTLLEDRIKRLERRVNDLEYKASKDDSVELDTGTLDGPYLRLNSNNGTFLVSLTNIEKYLNGYKVILTIGNTSSATYRGFELTLKWSTTAPEGDINKWVEWYKARKTKTEKYTQDLVPGSWNKVEMILLPARSDELGYLEVSMETNSISLYVR